MAAGAAGLVRRGPNPVMRLAARYSNAPVLVDDPALAGRLRLDTRVSVISKVFDEDIAEAIDALSRPVIDLPGGAKLSIWPTPALIAIDIDGGSALKGSSQSGLRHEALNRTVVPALGEQIKLRNLSGGIVVDLAGLSARKRASLAPDFVSALANDPLQPKFLGFTALGLAEIVRSRVHPPLHELLSSPLATGLAALRGVMADYSLGSRVTTSLRVHPQVASALHGDPEAMPDLVRRIGRSPTLRSDPSLPETVWILEKDHG